MAGWPVIGRPIRIGVAVVRLPEFRAEFLARNGHAFSGELGFADAHGRAALFESEQLPTLLQTVSALNQRQLASDNDRVNLVKSVPVALRSMGRDIADTRAELKRIEQALSAQRDSLAAQLGEATAALARHEAALARQEAALAEQGAALAEQAAARAQQDQAQAQQAVKLDGAVSSVEYLLGRVEFVRRELMFQMRYGAAAQDGADTLLAPAEILAPDKVAAARQHGLRLNLGCGHIALDGYLNVDRRALPGVDIVAEVDRLPFGDGELAEIFSAHLLEHFPQEQLRRALLPYYFSLLAPGGKFAAVVPDAEAMLREYSNGNYPYDWLREVLYGGQDYDGDFHFNMFTPASMRDYLLEAGFVNPRVIASARQNGRCYEFEIAAERPAGGAVERAP